MVTLAFAATLAHSGEAPGNLWLAWTLDPLLVLELALLLGAYLYAVGPLRRRWSGVGPVSRAQITWFILGWLTLVIALMSPLDTLGDEYLFSAHMIQHMLLAVVAPPLLLLGVPRWLWDPLFRGATSRRVARWLAHPVVAFGLLQADIWLWHAPALYDLTLANDTVHVVEHLTFFVFGALFWIPCLDIHPAVPRMSKGFAILYLFVGCQPMVALGALITFASQPLYAPYISAPRVWGLSPLADQQLGGLIMWLPSNIPYLIALSILFFQWVGERDRAERAAAGEVIGEIEEERPAPAVEIE
ncbi:MAG TPA: cytochrome c oxidase assembly protein [Ktedonobacterales bacterium]